MGSLLNPYTFHTIYDDLNRLLSAAEKVGTTDTWKQTFTFDRYGNRRYDAANTTTLGSCSAAVCNPDISTTTNRFTTTGYDYDENGNLTEDAQGQRFVYDSGNHQTEFFVSTNETSEPDATYFYDGDGKRVKKISATETTIFVYNAGGTLVAEYSTDLAETQQVSYLTADHLGSPRVITNENGEVTTRKDYAAFGEEIFTSERVSGLSYSSSQEETRKGYTGYEKDEESGLDFAQARYYHTKHGRFTSVDPLTASSNVKDPQTFNRYSYAMNSPYKFTDPLGLISVTTGACGQCNDSDIGGGGGGFDDPSNNFLQQDDSKKKQKKEPKKKQTQKKSKTPPKKSKKQSSKSAPIDGPKPVSAEIVSTKTGPDAVTKSDGTVLIAGMTQLIFEVIGDDGKPFVGTITEQVVSTEFGQSKPTKINKDIVPLKDGQFGDFITGSGGFEGPAMPNPADLAQALSNVDLVPTKVEQTATFTIRSSTTNATLTIVHTRTLTNLDGSGNLRAPKNGTRFVFYERGLTVTPSP